MPHKSTNADNKEHKDMIAHLIQITEDCVREHVAAEASVMAGVAQRVDPMLNIKISIEYASYLISWTCDSRNI